MRKTYRAASLIIVALVMLAGCQKQEESKKKSEVPPSQKPAKPSAIVVPDSVRGKWKGVKIALTDKEKGRESVYTVNMGNRFSFPGTKMAVLVENFLPDFTMNGTVMTSQSNEPKNPAARVRIYEDEKEIFNGWLFSLYPTIHAVQHAKYGFTLTGYIPSK